MSQFTASEVRAACTGHHPPPEATRKMLHAFADLLEAQERAVPVAHIEEYDLADRHCRGLVWADHPADTKEHTFTPLFTHPPAASLSASEIEWLQYTVAHMEEDSEPEDRQCAQVIRGLLARIGATGEGDITNPPAASVTDAEDAARYRWLREGDNDDKVLERTGDDWDEVFLPRLERLDAAIDAARAKEPQS